MLRESEKKKKKNRPLKELRVVANLICSSIYKRNGLCAVSILADERRGGISGSGDCGSRESIQSGTVVETTSECFNLNKYILFYIQYT